MTRYTADWILPIATPPIAHGEVAVEGGRITYVGPAREGGEGELRPLGHAVVLPGLVNTHTHLELTAMRGFLEGLEFRPWIHRLTRARHEVLTVESLRASARVGIAEGLLAGVTTFADTCESGVVLAELVEMGARGVMYQEVFGPDPAQCDAALAGLREKVGSLRRTESSAVRLGVSPHAPYTVSDPLFAAVARFARDEGLPVAVHAAESEEETRLVRDGEGGFADALRARGLHVAGRASSPIALLERTGVLGVRPLLIHCVRVDEADVARIAGHDCAVAHCPASNAKLGHGIAPLTALLKAGVRVGLGSDSVASNNRMDLLDEARLASLFQRADGRRHDILPAARTLELATAGGARALGMLPEVGTLEVGKWGDLAAFALGSARAVPAFAPEDALLWALAGRAATLTVVAGRELVRDGALVASRDADLAHVAGIARMLADWQR